MTPENELMNAPPGITMGENVSWLVPRSGSDADSLTTSVLPSSINWSGTGTIEGGSFTGRNVRVTTWVTVNAPSLKVSVRLALPDWFAAGITVTSRTESEPPKRMLAGGTRTGFEEVMVSTSAAAGVSASLTGTVKVIGTSSLDVRLVEAVLPAEIESMNQPGPGTLLSEVKRHRKRRDWFAKAGGSASVVVMKPPDDPRHELKKL